MLGVDLFGFAWIKGVFSQMFSGGISGLIPWWVMGFWHFLVKIDQVISTRIVMIFQKVSFFPDLLSVEISVAFFFVVLCLILWRYFWYIFTVVVGSYVVTLFF